MRILIRGEISSHPPQVSPCTTIVSLVPEMRNTLSPFMSSGGSMEPSLAESRVKVTRVWTLIRIGCVSQASSALVRESSAQ